MRVNLTLVCLTLTILACNHSENLTSANKMKQGIRGSVTEVKGNQMPGPGRELPPPKAIQTTVYVFEPTSLSQVVAVGASPLYSAIRTKLVDSVQTDEKGLFAFSLKPGTYSIFARVDGYYFANVFDGKNTIAPVTVEEGKVTEANILVNDKATY